MLRPCVYVKIQGMKTKLPFPQDHPSYQLHRRQMWTQILLPLLLTVLFFIAVILLTGIATFRDNGEVGRWAAISTIWLVIPFMLAGLIFLALLAGMIYLLARLVGVIPPYSYQVQGFVYRIEGHVKRGAELTRKPVLLVDILKSQIKKMVQRS
jgi:energy-coupling factor transporter transmembrane protein EcfT